MAEILARIKQRPALRWGLIFGLILGIVDIAYNFAGSFVTDAGAQNILGFIPAVLFLVFGFYAGLRASQETSRWTSGLVAGIWVAVIGTLIFYVIPLINVIVNIQSIIENQRLLLKAHPVSGVDPANYGASDVFVALLVEMLISMISCAFCTLIGGALGGFMGRRRALASKTSEAYEESLFQPPVSDEEAAPAEVKGEATT